MLGASSGLAASVRWDEDVDAKDATSDERDAVIDSLDDQLESGRKV